LDVADSALDVGDAGRQGGFGLLEGLLFGQGVLELFAGALQAVVVGVDIGVVCVVLDLQAL
jgi:hypothetical protein